MERIDRETPVKRGPHGGGLDPVEPVWRVLLRVLDDYGPLTAFEIAGKAGLMAGYDRQRRLARVNGVFFYANKRHGEVVYHADTIPSEYHNVPTYVWDLTDHGRDMLAQPWPPGPSARAVREAARTQNRMEEAARRARVAQVAAEHGWAPGIAIPERRLAVAELRAAGASLQEIGDVFGMSREQARLDLVPGSHKGGSARSVWNRANLIAALRSPEAVAVLKEISDQPFTYLTEDLAQAILAAHHRLRYGRERPA